MKYMKKTEETVDKDMADTAKEIAKPNAGIVKFGEDELKRDAGVGMSKVDPADIRPPSVMLIQKSSDLSLFVDSQGKQPSIGQFFHTGRLAITDKFECYFLFCAKGTYVKRTDENQEEKPQYKAVGAMADDLSVFGMVFRSSALFALSSLFTATVGRKRPMYSIKVSVETKELKGEKGTWHIPVVRIADEENDPVILSELSKMAHAFDRRGDAPIEEDSTERPAEPKEEMPF